MNGKINSMNHKGFSLVELMVVIAIVAVLTAIALPMYQNYVSKAKIAEAYSFLGSNKAYISEQVISNGGFLTNLETTEAVKNGKYGGVTSSPSGVITYTFTDSSLNGNTIKLTPAIVSDGIKWTCETTVPQSQADPCTPFK